MPAPKGCDYCRTDVMSLCFLLRRAHLLGWQWRENFSATMASSTAAPSALVEALKRHGVAVLEPCQVQYPLRPIYSPALNLRCRYGVTSRVWWSVYTCAQGAHLLQEAMSQEMPEFTDFIHRKRAGCELLLFVFHCRNNEQNITPTKCFL